MNTQEQRPGLEGQSGPISIGEALQVSGLRNPDKEIDIGVVSAIRSAEGRATGVKGGLPNGPAAQGQNVLDRSTSPMVMALGEEETLGTITAHAMDAPQLEKPVNILDAQRVVEAEMLNSSTGQVDQEGIAAAIKAAADYNVSSAYVNPNVL